MRSTRLLACAAVALAMPRLAGADTGKAWATARDNLPAASIVVGADVTAIARSMLFTTVFPLALAQRSELKRGFELVKSTCRIDPLTAIQGVVIGMDADHKGAAYLALNGVDPARLATCLEDIAKASGKDAKVAIARSGPITEITIAGTTVYVRWFGSDVLAIALDPRDKEQLRAFTGQRGTLRASPIYKNLASVDTKAALWGASTIGKTFDADVNVKHGYGALTVANGNLATDVHVALDSAKSATDTAARATSQLATAAASLPARLKAVVQGITITAAGAELVMKASVPEADLLALVGSFVRP